MKKQSGFSLVELLIVVAIILIIAAIAIPNLIRAKIAANESAAVASMRTIFTAEAAYDAQGWNNPTAVGFSNVLADLGNKTCNPPTLSSACLLDDNLANASTPARNKSGYYFTYKPITVATKNTDFTLNGDPLQRGSTGIRSFYSDTTGVIRFNLSAPAQLTDPAI